MNNHDVPIPAIKLPRTTKPHFVIQYTNGQQYKTPSLAYSAAIKWASQLPQSHEIHTNTLPLFIKITKDLEITFHFSN